MYKVIVTYYYESETHCFNTLEEAQECFKKYSEYTNTYVELKGPDIHITNGKEYLF